MDTLMYNTWRWLLADGDEVVVLLVGDQSNYHHDLQGADMDAFLNGTLCVLWLNRAFRDVLTLILDTRLLQFKLCFESATELLNLKQTELEMILSTLNSC